MIKILYMASIPFFLLLILIFATLNLTYKSPVVNKEVKLITENLIKNSPISNMSETVQSNNNVPIPSELWTNNIFDSSRALFSSVSGGSSVSLKDVTLVGVFDYGAIAGGVFLMNNPQGMPGGNYFQGGGTPGGYGVPQPQGKEPPPKPKMVFLVGERLPNGFLLKSVGIGSAILQGGGEAYPLSIQYADDDSLKRIADMQRTNNTQQQARIIEPGSSGSGNGSNSGANNSNIVIRNTPNTNQNN